MPEAASLIEKIGAQGSDDRADAYCRAVRLKKKAPPWEGGAWLLRNGEKRYYPILEVALPPPAGDAKNTLLVRPPPL